MMKLDVKGSVPAAALWAYVNAHLAALGNEVRQLLLARLIVAGQEGLRLSEAAKLVGHEPPSVRKHLAVLEGAQLVERAPEADKSGLYSRYAATDSAVRWFDWTRLRVGDALVPLAAKERRKLPARDVRAAFGAETVSGAEYRLHRYGVAV